MSKVSEKQIINLPIYKSEDDFIAQFKANTITVLTGETGSGKTTQVPKILLKHNLIKDGTMIVITQPRRVAALSIAHRVSDELNSKIGDVVGYSVRFAEKTSKNTNMLSANAALIPGKTVMYSTYAFIITKKTVQKSKKCINIIVNGFILLAKK